MSSKPTIAYVDGACSGNPGPCGIGAVLLDGASVYELSEYLGQGTNNIAELTGVWRALERVENRAAPLRIYTDSSYSIGVLTKNWKAKANVELIANIVKELRQFKDIQLIHVRGHAGHEHNERADFLARTAVQTQETSDWKQVT